MNQILEELKKTGYIMGRYQSNPDVCLAKGINNTIIFSAVGSNAKGIMEIDGKNIEVVSGGCFKIEHEGAEIFLSPSGNDRGEFTAGLTGITMADDTTVEYMLKLITGQ